jgi:hypothetical protein
MPEFFEDYSVEELQELMRLFPEVYFDMVDNQ